MHHAGQISLRRLARAAVPALALAAACTLAAPAAHADTVTPTVHCVLPAGQGENTGPQSVSVTLTPATVAPGGKVHAEVTLGPSPATSPLALSAVPTTPSIYFTMSGGATGTVSVTGPTVPVDIPAAPAPIVIPPYGGDFFVPSDASGPVTFTPLKMNTQTVVLGSTFQTPCDIVSGSGGIGTVTVQGGGGGATTLTAPASAVRPSTSVALSGSGFTAGGTPVVSLCDAQGLGCDPSRFTADTLAIDSSGALSGSATLAASSVIADGTYQVQVSDGAKHATADLTVKAFVPTGARSVTLSPDHGPLGTVVTVSGGNFHQDQYINVWGVDADGNQTADDAVYPVSTPDGTFTAEFTVNDPATTAIHTDESGADGSDVNAKFTVGDSGGATATQKISATVTAGNLQMTQSGDTIDFGTIPLTGRSQTATSALNTVTVVDSRGVDLGWSLTGTLTDLTSGQNTIPASAVRWTPDCVRGSQSVGTPAPGTPGPLGSTAATLCQLTAAGGEKVVGGTVKVNADMDLRLPAVTAPGDYSAILTLTLT
ncbi:hypothetical protein ABZX65_27900 [Streptomyces sp. NPDC003300]|uniref:hypothetical protein n=1 Tax=unclassified Streptomyces TaxID=2593676 RepID=UPI0033BBABBE